MKLEPDLLLCERQEVFLCPKTIILALAVTGELLLVSSMNL